MQTLTMELQGVIGALKRGERCSQGSHGALTDALEVLCLTGSLPEPGWAEVLGRERAIDDAGLRREAGRLLVHLGRWDGHDDVTLLSSSLLKPLPPEVLEASPKPTLPDDLSEDPGPWVSIDSADPQEIDDALSARQEGEEIVLRVAIASTASFVSQGDRIDREARERGGTFYHPRYSAPMLPPQIGEDRASLNEGKLRPALLFELRIDRAGVARMQAVREALIRVGAALSYDQAQVVLDGDPSAEPEWVASQLRLLAEAALRSESHRIGRGAWLLYRPELEVWAPRHGEVVLRRAEQGQLARRVVGEAMVLCGQAAASFGREHGVPMPYRVQPAPRMPSLPPGLYTVPADIYSMLRHMSSARFVTRPGPHAVLGLDAYVQASSPLRRYGDLVAHRQILSVLRGTNLRMSATAIRKAMEHADGRVRRYRSIDRQARRYFTLVSLASGGLGQRLRGQLVDDPARKGRTLAFVPELALEVELRGYSGETGDWLELELQGVDLQSARLEVEVRARLS